MSRDACRVRWSGVAINATNRVHQCVFYPLSYWIHGGAAGDEYIWLFPTSAAMLDHPTRHAPPHMSCGRRWRTGRASGPYSSRRPRGWSALILYGRYGLIGRLSVSPIQIVWGFPPYVLYGQTSAYFQKWTGGGKTTLILKRKAQYWAFRSAPLGDTNNKQTKILVNFSIEEISRQGPSLDKDQCGPRQIAHAFRPFYMGPAGDFFSTGL